MAASILAVVREKEIHCLASHGPLRSELAPATPSASAAPAKTEKSRASMCVAADVLCSKVSVCHPNEGNGVQSGECKERGEKEIPAFLPHLWTE